LSTATIILPMTITLDAESEKLVLRELELGHAAEPAEVVARALAAHALAQDWTEEDRSWLNERLRRSSAQISRGEGLTPEAARHQLADWKAGIAKAS
jgi:hypothetical protein